jgi:hypothetical protein
VASLKAKQRSSMTRGDANDNEEQDRPHHSTAGELCIDAAWNQFGFETASPTTLISEAMIFLASQPSGPKGSALMRICRSSLALANTHRHANVAEQIAGRIDAVAPARKTKCQRRPYRREA